MKELKLELVLKRPKDKPPFIGVCFESEFEAGKYNQWYIDNPEQSTFRGLVIEPKKGRLEIKIVPFYVMGHTYTIEKFNAWDLQTFLTYAMSQKIINFGHVTKKFDEHILVKTMTRKNWVIKINHIDFMKEH